jgi:hypothetical protein
MSDWIKGDSTSVIRVMGRPAADPFAFIRTFRKAIKRAYDTDPKLFQLFLDEDPITL